MFIILFVEVERPIKTSDYGHFIANSNQQSLGHYILSCFDGNDFIFLHGSHVLSDLHWTFGGLVMMVSSCSRDIYVERVVEYGTRLRSSQLCEMIGVECNTEH